MKLRCKLMILSAMPPAGNKLLTKVGFTIVYLIHI